ncbi:MAG TPA: DUF1801 domain-containing protein [Actinomycetota bacterium]|nr:DUF1801 domain-containing protein [Actinomycetota bacterium]
MATTTAKTPEQYIRQLEEPRRDEVRRLHELIRKTAPKLEPYMESGMIGYGRYHYRSASGREGEWCLLGLASRKRYISFYVVAEDGMGGYLAESYRDRLPKADIGRSCVRFKRLDDLDEKVLREMIRAAAKRPLAAAP